MISNYTGHYAYNRQSIGTNAPEDHGVYYCGYPNSKNALVILYVGRAVGDGVTIRSRLYDHLRDDNWSDVTHFGYAICSTVQEAKDFEESEIEKYKPRYNTQNT